MWRYLLPAAVFLVLVGFFVAGLYRDPTIVPSPLIGKPAPAFSLPKVENTAETVSLDDFKGQVFVLNVWAHGVSGAGRNTTCCSRSSAAASSRSWVSTGKTTLPRHSSG